ncbi:MAG: hypothetical protein KAI24_18215, partial [Planctomycetes bacterium]|nr:hypothetical protein [Planctomycetota bacterium]
MPHPLHTVARRHHVATLVAATLALASCNFGYTTRYRRTLDSGDRITIGIESQHVSQHVELRRESRGDIDVYRVVRLEPRTDPADRDGLRWLFRSLRPDIALRFDDGTTVEHPDLAIAAQLRERLDEPDPDLAEALDGMRDLLRLESRERVFAAAAGRAQLPAELEVLVGALAEPGALLAACPDGEAPGGSRSKCLQACVTSLAHHPQLDRLRADRIARLVDRIGHSSRESEALQTLIPTASPEAVTDAALRIGSSKARSTVLQQLAVKQDLSRDEADRIAAAVDGVGSSSREAEVLVALLPKASPEALVHAAVQVGSSRRRFELLHALAQREDLTR